MPPWSLRPVGPDDETLLQQLYASARQEEVAAWGWSSGQTDAFLLMQGMAQRSSYKARFPDAIHSIIMQGHEPVGQCYVDYTPLHLRLVDISILPAFRNRGLGSIILQSFQLEATRRRIPIFLSVASGNPARRFYERLGFTIDGAADMYMSMTWQPITIIPHGEGIIDE